MSGAEERAAAGEVEVEVLAGIVRAGLDATAEDAARGYLHAPEIPGYEGWDKSTVAGLPPAVAARVLAQVEALRGLLDAILAEKHEVSDNQFYTCRAATVEHDGDEYGDGNQPGPCDCGRDARVLRLLRHLAAAYQTTTEEGQ